MNSSPKAKPSIVLNGVGVIGGSVGVPTPSGSRMVATAGVHCGHHPLAKGPAEMGTCEQQSLLWVSRELNPIRGTHPEQQPLCHLFSRPHECALNDSVRFAHDASRDTHVRIHALLASFP
jgi:hypothetical protein